MNNYDLWEAIPIACLLTSKSGLISDINPSAEILFNVSKKKVLKQKITSIFKSDINFLKHFSDLGTGSNTLKFKSSIIHLKDVAILTDIRIIFTNNKYLIMMETDANNNFGNLSLADNATQSVVGMAEMLAHEIKNPIAGITSAAQLLEMTLSNKDRKFTRLIILESKRIIKLLETFDKFGDLREPQLRAENIHDILENAKIFSQVKDRKNIFLSDNYDPSLPKIFCDRVQLEQVFINLINNSVTALKDVKKGKIVLRTFFKKGLSISSASGSKVELSLHIEIEDNGLGIPNHMIDQIFEPFVSGSTNGTGLGLALVSKVISTHSGTINVTSDKAGTIFTISLPVY